MARLKIILILLVIFSLSSPVSAQDEISFIFGGDVTFGGHYSTIAPQAYKDLTWSFKNLHPFFEKADIVMVNCENAITTTDKKIEKKFNFKMDPRMIGIFAANNISIVSLANNHVYDYGKIGLDDTIKYLDGAGIAHVGAGRNLDEARKPVIKNIKSKKIFFLAYGNFSPATNSSPGVAYRHKDDVIKDIKKAKEQGADVVVVNMHWGIERDLYPTASDKELAHAAIDNGADVIIGHHPHVVQPIDIYKNKIIAYSLGNFIFGGNTSRLKEGLLIKINIKPDNSIEFKKIKIKDTSITKYQPYVVGD